jgi:Tol biopolymer transport system component
MKKMLFIFCVIFVLLSCTKEEHYSLQVKKSIPLPKQDTLIVFIAMETISPYDWGLYKMNLDGTGRALIASSLPYEYPVISNSGDKILYIGKDHGSGGLFMTDLSGNITKKIDRADRSIASPVWSLNDSLIVYSKNKPGLDERDLMLYEVNSGSKRVLLSLSDDIVAHGFIDNDRVIYTRGWSDIYVMNIDGSSNQKIISNGSSPILSPDRNYFAYVWYSERESPQIFVSDLQGHSVKLTSNALPNFDSGQSGFGSLNPRWTPDGSKIVYECDVNDQNSQGKAEIYIMNNDGSNKQRLTNNDSFDGYPQISSEGNRIIFVSDRDSHYGIYQMDISGTNQSRLSQLGACPVFVSRVAIIK